MIDEHQREGSSNGGGETLGQAVEGALMRMKRLWRVQEWTPELLTEYRRVLTKVGSSDVLEQVMDEVIDATEGNFAPAPGTFAKHGRDIAERYRRETVRSGNLYLTDDESALRDAIAALDSPYFADADGQAMVMEQIAEIRRRLPDHGARVDAEVRPRPAGAPLPEKPRFVVAVPHRGDPPGTLRFVVEQPNGLRVPSGARTVEDQAAGL